MDDSLAGPVRRARSAHRGVWCPTVARAWGSRMLSVVVAAVVASTASWSCEEEDERVVQHLEDVLGQLRAFAPGGLSEKQLEARGHVLDDLARSFNRRTSAAWRRSTSASSASGAGS